MATFIALVYFTIDFLPMPARAADLDKLVEVVQKQQDTYESEKDSHRIKHLQDQIADINLQFMIAGKTLSPEAIFYIKQKETEIENIRKGDE